MLQKNITQQTEKTITKPITSFWDALLAQKGFIAYLPIIVSTILMFCGVSWQIFWLSTDPARYQCYALTFWLGSNATHLLPATQCAFLPASAAMQPPFHALPLEYPPLTLVLFSIALLAPIPYYQLFFALLMALTGLLIYWLLLRFGPKGSAFIFAVYLLTGSWALAQVRFDLVPALLTLLCLIAVEHRQWRYAYIALAFGVLFKIYPILLLPFIFIAEQRDAQRMYLPPEKISLVTMPEQLWSTLQGIRRWQWRNSLLFLGILVVVTAFFAVFNFYEAFVSQLSYFSGRPVQIESTGSTFLWLARNFGYPAHVEYTFGSLNIYSGLSGVVTLTGTISLLAGYLYILWLQWRGSIDMPQASLAAVLLFIATGKVFSPQYLIWVMPLLAYCCAFDGLLFIVWNILSFATTLIYTYFYAYTQTPSLIFDTPGFAVTVAFRNALFVLVTLAYLFDWLHIRQRKPLPSRAAREEADYQTFDEVVSV